MSKKKTIGPCIDVIGRKVTWKPVAGDRLYGEVCDIQTYMAKPKKLMYPTQRIIKKKLLVCLNDGRILKISGEHEDLKKMGISAESS